MASFRGLSKAQTWDVESDVKECGSEFIGIGKKLWKSSKLSEGPKMNRNEKGKSAKHQSQSCKLQRQS